MYPQALEPDEQPRVDAEMKKLLDEQSTFDAKHPDFDGGARLRMIHLRRRIEFSQRLLPVVTHLFGTDDGITRLVKEALGSDTDEYRDVSSEG